jgi:hypothetical protein
MCDQTSKNKATEATANDKRDGRPDLCPVPSRLTTEYSATGQLERVRYGHTDLEEEFFRRLRHLMEQLHQLREQHEDCMAVDCFHDEFIGWEYMLSRIEVALEASITLPDEDDE